MNCNNTTDPNQKLTKPPWLRVKLPIGENYKKVRNLVDNNKLHTICESGNCPNMGECWGEGTATFMILGNICTRSCRFCNVATGKPEPVDWNEPQRVAETIFLMQIKHAVITSVDRDELSDGGAQVWYNTIKAIKMLNPTTSLETLIPDFKAAIKDITLVASAQPEVISHNIETVERITPLVRVQAKYQRSLEVLKILKSLHIRTKSGIMLGIGETKEEVFKTLEDLKSVDLDVVTIGQYLQPTSQHLPIQRFVHPDEFLELKEYGYALGFDYVESGPLVRSSYHSERHVIPGLGKLRFKNDLKTKIHQENLYQIDSQI
ncbi:MAG: lipoyl synthase [Alphaproteobacteria bacterium]|nr:lipoyl synthase [Alphaproteobacteria bacterium]